MPKLGIKSNKTNEELLQDKKDAASAVVESLRKRFSDNVVFFGDDDKLKNNISVLSTGSIGLDIATGVGGVPQGRIVEIYGPESSGKTTLALSIIAQAQKKDLLCAYIDMEHALDLKWAKMLGVEPKKIIISQPDTGDDALEICEEIIESNAVGVVVLDSVAALVPRAEMEGDMSDSVSFDTPVYIRNKIDGFINIIPISDLYHGGFDFKGNRRIYTKNQSIEVLTHKGWANLKSVICKRNPNNKDLVITRTNSGYIKTTRDHCLFMNGEEKTFEEINIFDRLDTYSPKFSEYNQLVFDCDIAWLLGFWVAEGTTLRTSNSNRFEVSNTHLEFIEKCAKIISTHFMCKLDVRKPKTTDNRQQLHILSCSSSKELGFLLQQCVTKNSKLKTVPKFILNSNNAVKSAFLDGFWCGDGSHSREISKGRQFYNNSLSVMAGIQFLLKSLDVETSLVINKKRYETVRIIEVLGNRNQHKDEVRHKIESGEIPEFLYDIETEHGTFVTALGDIVVHNSHVGLQARLMARALRKLTSKLSATKTTMIFTNQLRDKIGGFGFAGSPETTTGGRALKFYASMRFDVRRIEQIKHKEQVIGARTRAKITKNKVASPFREAEFEIMFDEGISNTGEIIDLAVEDGIVLKNGAFFKYEGSNFAQGRENARKYLMENPTFAFEIHNKILEAKSLPKLTVIPDYNKSLLAKEIKIQPLEETKKVKVVEETRRVSIAELTDTTEDEETFDESLLEELENSEE